jgi:hypothetical protein
LQRPLGVLRRATPQHCLHASQKLFRTEGLDDVVVGTTFEAGDAVRLLTTRGEQDDRQAARASLALRSRPISARPDFPGSIQSTSASSGSVSRNRGLGVLGAVSAERLIATAQQRKAQQFLNTLVVLDDKNLRQADSLRARHHVARHHARRTRCAERHTPLTM